MSEFWVLVLLLFLLLGLGSLEYFFHKIKRDRIPIRIHVNGTRGKSSVTRLIASGLRAGGFRVLAKTTGTVPKLILPDGTEKQIFRYGVPNILEQKDAIKEAEIQKVQAVVLECMALVPFNQKVSEEKLIRATHSVITNVKDDHLEIMGPEKSDVAIALSHTIGRENTVFTSEKEFLTLIENSCKIKNSRIVPTSLEKFSKLDYMRGFSYFEHPENVVLALEVCASFGISPEIAIQGMWSHSPDLGASFFRSYWLGEKNIGFGNGFAANDPDSASFLWEKAILQFPEHKYKIALVNCRNDRQERSEQIAKEILSWKKYSPDLVICVGEETGVFLKTWTKSNGDGSKLFDLKNSKAGVVLEFLENIRETKVLVVGLGNISGFGLEFLSLLKTKEGSTS
ncbi:poly-gamma-glutamate synthase PgsB [Leptospira sarikeiensis]|uniref:Poly-gamma-glutamate synthase PgsB n=1 Tax=Leptospira sarikeiensis TaxID=2484943 RepID=A0A4R9K2B3_9LEPT|nr:poly-gamma-glutamate synthase PgsB [Leptospira sarikeiensis]TGL58336.1 poly-gamma-glutamate synthase PgsB [Leptospira sarikeiensis]